MGERLLCKQEVVGSIPSASTRDLKIGGWCRGDGGLSGIRQKETQHGNVSFGSPQREDWSGIMDSVKTIVK